MVPIISSQRIYILILWQVSKSRRLIFQKKVLSRPSRHPVEAPRSPKDTPKRPKGFQTAAQGPPAAPQRAPRPPDVPKPWECSSFLHFESYFWQQLHSFATPKSMNCQHSKRFCWFFWGLKTNNPLRVLGHEICVLSRHPSDLLGFFSEVDDL